jgi:hypothetical protein
VGRLAENFGLGPDMSDIINRHLEYKLERLLRLSGCGIIGLIMLWLWIEMMDIPYLNGIAALTVYFGIMLSIYAFLQPWNGVIFFIWVACLIDTVKRIAYIWKPYSFFDLSLILGVPVVVMGMIYLRVIFFNWFIPQERIPLDRGTFYITLCFLAAAVVGLLAGGGLSFRNLAKNYNFLCYVPAAIVIPHLFFKKEHWAAFSKTVLILMLVLLAYGNLQAFHGPLEFEKNYFLSGYTSMTTLVSESYFRPYSFLNGSATYAGIISMFCFFSFFFLCRRKNGFQLTLPVAGIIGLVLFSLVMSTQRGGTACFLITLIFLFLLRHPRMIYLLSGVTLLAYALMIVYIEEVWELLKWLHWGLEPYRTNEFLEKNTGLLTFGPRYLGIKELHNSQMWKPFGGGLMSGHEGLSAGHDLVSNMLAWVGYVGLAIFMLLVILILISSVRLLEKNKKEPEVLLWTQINFSIFFFIVVWSASLGIAFHVNPMNFFFWAACGNLIFLNSGYWRKDEGVDENRSPSTMVPESALKTS